MHNKWTRERIIRSILELEAKGLPLTVGRQGVNQGVYQAGARIFGSWRNAIQAAGIPPERVLGRVRWSPAKVLMVIRNLSRRRRPLTLTQLGQRNGSIISAARRFFGSWANAVVTAGVDPANLRRVVPWTQERVIEAILTRSLRNKSLAARYTEPKSLVMAGKRFFGSWISAIAAAGLDPKAVTVLPELSAEYPSTYANSKRRSRSPWTKDSIIVAIHARLREHKPINAMAVEKDNPRLFRAARHHLRGWSKALLLAGLNPAEYQRYGRCNTQTNRPDTCNPSIHKSQQNEVMRPNLPA